MTSPTVAEMARQLARNSAAPLYPTLQVLTDYGGFEVALGYHGIGVFITNVGVGGRRRLITLGLSEAEAAKLGRALIQAAEASGVHRAQEAER